MCDPFTALAVISTVATIGKTVFAKKPKVPKVVKTDPVADDLAAQTKAAQEAQAAKLEQRRRRTTLLSQAGAAGDLSQADTMSGGAQPFLGS